MTAPVFFDASGRRQIWFRRVALLVLGALALACVAFASTVVKVPAPSPLPIAYERMTPLPFRTQISRICWPPILRIKGVPSNAKRFSGLPRWFALIFATDNNLVDRGFFVPIIRKLQRTQGASNVQYFDLSDPFQSCWARA